jgi:S-DNA-T family DNA segregation ATPase FtsK/SpoIIIE
VLLTAPGLSPTWTWARWLPHLGGRVGDTSAIQASLVAGLVAHLDERRGSLRNAHWTGPWTVIVIDGASALAELPGLAQLLQSGPEYGITAICLDEYQQRLPAACTAIASVTGETGTRLRVERAGELPQADVIADQVSGSWADAVARALASLVDASSDVGSTIPTECRLLEINGIERPSESAVLECWRTGGRPLATLGVSGDGAMTIDLAADGPHTLIAGTTGAGKSELLQSLVAGLAISNSPSDLSFILIDYKGGAAFADCARLPHTAGLVTDLDGHLTERALRSLNAELRRREALFAAAGATDLAAYRDSPEHVLAPLGRLVLVVDEFAALADELPDLLTGLVSVAQRGRSLGLHLVLATQRPAGVVSPEIQANLALRISLRVTDPGESATVIGTDAAARIDKGRPGRAYVRTGTTLTEFQTARVAAPGPRGSADEITITRLDEWGRAAFANEPATDRPSDLSLLADTMRAAAASAGLIAPTSPWLPPLPERVGLADLARTGPPSAPLAGGGPGPGAPPPADRSQHGATYPRDRGSGTDIGNRLGAVCHRLCRWCTRRTGRADAVRRRRNPRSARGDVAAAQSAGRRGLAATTAHGQPIGRIAAGTARPARRLGELRGRQ